MVFAAVVGMMGAQTLQFEHMGTIYENGATIISPYDEDFGEYIQELQIRNLTNNDLSVCMEQNTLESTDGASLQLCWGISCYDSDLFGHILTRAENIVAQSLSEMVSLHCSFHNGETGVVKAVYTAYPSNDPTDVVRINVLYGHSASVSENGSLMGSDNLHVTVYNLLGQEVKSMEVSGHQTSARIAVNDLKPGIYFCRYSANGETVKTEKIIVNR